jgi:hypothetical protein
MHGTLDLNAIESQELIMPRLHVLNQLFILIVICRYMYTCMHGNSNKWRPSHSFMSVLIAAKLY